MPFLGALPIDSRLMEAQEKGLNVEDLYPDAPVVLAMRRILGEIQAVIGK